MKVRRSRTKYKFVKKVITIETMKNNKTKVRFPLRVIIFTFCVDLTNANLHLFIMIVLPDTLFCVG